MAQGHKDVTVMQRLWVRFFVLAPRQKPGAEFRHSTRNAPKTLTESGVRRVLTLRSPTYPTIREIQRKADLII